MVSTIRRDLALPSYKQGFARNATQSARPQDWKGLIGLWMPSLGPTGTKLFDLSGYGNHGTLTSMDPATDWVIRPGWGYALDYDASDDHVLFGAASVLDVEPVTVSVWLKYTSTAERGIININTGSFTNDWQITTNNGTPAGAIVVVRSLTSSDNQQTDSAYNDGVWHLLTGVTAATAAAIKIYIDGLLVASSVVVEGFGSSSGMVLGARNTAPQSNFGGSIGDLRIYDHALTAREVWEQYADPFGIVRPSQDIIGRVAAAGLSIPVSMYSYRRRHQSVF